MVCFRYLAVRLLMILVMTNAADAMPVRGTDSIVSFDVGTDPVQDLLSTVSSGGTITFDTVFWSKGNGSLAGIPTGTPINDFSLALTTTGVDSFAFTSADGSFQGASSLIVGGTTYTPRITGETGSISASTETVGLYLIGTFRPAGSINSFGPDSMSIALTLNENGITSSDPGDLGSFSASFTVATPAIGPGTPGIPLVPEPASIVILATGLFGLGVIKHMRVDASGRMGPSLTRLIGRCLTRGYIGHNDRLLDPP